MFLLELHCLLIMYFTGFKYGLACCIYVLGLRNKVISEIGKKVGKMESGSLVAILCLLSFVILQVSYVDI